MLRLYCTVQKNLPVIAFPLRVSAGLFFHIQSWRVLSHNDLTVYSKLMAFIVKWIKGTFLRVKGLSLSLGFHISFFVCLFLDSFVCLFFLSLGSFVCHFDLCSCLTACCFSYMLFIYSFIFAFTFACNYFVCLFFFLVFDVFSSLWSRESIFLLSTYHFQVKNNVSPV